VAALNPYEFLALAVVALVLVAFVTIYMLRTYRLRRLASLRKTESTPALARDRAYNRLALARREADLLEAQGGDVARARQLLALSDHSMASRDFDRAYELAQAAHETLVQSRRQPVRGAPPPGTAAPDARTGPLPTAPAPAPVAAVPKNRAEAQFQLRLFDQELAEAKARKAAGPGVPDAGQLNDAAHSAYANGDYGEAFRLALRGRRRVGGHVEALGSPAPAAPATAGGRGADDATQLAEQVAAADRCPSCGHPTVSGDGFCRGCGTAFAPSNCPKCGATRLSTDTFCGKCGLRYD